MINSPKCHFDLVTLINEIFMFPIWCKSPFLNLNKYKLPNANMYSNSFWKYKIVSINQNSKFCTLEIQKVSMENKDLMSFMFYIPSFLYTPLLQNVGAVH
jgi:hypothetical protein